MKKVNEQRIYSNYKRVAKFLGIIDYKSLVVIIAYIILIMGILSILPLSIEVLIYSFLILVVPVIAVFCININNESTVDILLIIIQFYLYKSIYVKIEYTKGYKKSKFYK